jgi:hypothetical protein
MVILAQRHQRKKVAIAGAPKYTRNPGEIRPHLFMGCSASRSQVAGLSNPIGVFTMTIASRAAVAAVASLLLAGTAFAQTAPAAKTDDAKKSDTMAPTDKMAKPHTAESVECSKEADAKGLKGKERKKFRAECKKEAADKMKK